MTQNTPCEHLLIKWNSGDPACLVCDKTASQDRSILDRYLRGIEEEQESI